MHWRGEINQGGGFLYRRDIEENRMKKPKLSLLSYLWSAIAIAVIILRVLIQGKKPFELENENKT
jgi:hypothetical protein